MSKIKFGNFITYTGKYLSTAMSKAQSGNLVFARIIDSPTKDSDVKAKVTLENVIVDGQLETSYEVNNINKDGYYIFGGKADGHLVTFDVFEALKAEVAALNTKVGDLKIGATTYANVPAYVDAKLANIGGAAAKGVTETVRSTTSATHDVLPTEKAVRDAIDAIPTYGVSGAGDITVTSSVVDGKNIFTVKTTDNVATKNWVNEQVSKIDGVMEFKGTVSTLPTVTADSEDYNPGDVVVFNNEEYVLDTDYKWVEIGQVGVDDAVTSAKGSTYVRVAGNGEGDEKRGDITISVVTSGITAGASGLATAADVYTAVEAAKNNAIGAANVTGATGYLKVDDSKNVVIDSAQVQTGTTNKDGKLVTKGYVEDQLEVISNNIIAVGATINARIDDVEEEAAKHSSVITNTTEYIKVDTVLGATSANGGVEYQINLKPDALQATNHSISAIQIDGEYATQATTVQEALRDLFEGQFTASESLVDLKEKIYTHIGSTQAHAAENITYAGTTGSTATNVEAALDDLYSKVTTVDGAAVKSVTGDAYVGTTTVNGAVTLTTDIARVVNTTTVIGYTAATATGLATDAYVKDYVAMSLSWEELVDGKPVVPGGTMPGGDIEM